MNKQIFLEAAQARASIGAKSCVPKVMNAEDAKRVNANAIYTVTLKYDGVNCSMTVIDGELIALSRTGKELTLCDYLRSNYAYYLSTYYPVGQVLCGELTHGTLTIEEFSGLVNPNRVNAWDDSVGAGVGFVVFDAVTQEEFVAGYSDTAFHRRIEGAYSHLHADIPAYRLTMASPCGVVYGDDLAKLDVIAQRLIAQGHEGVVAVERDSHWVAGKKDNTRLRIKRKFSVDLRCLDVKYGKGKREGLIAALQFSYKGKAFWADLGKGWTDVMRQEMTTLHEEHRYIYQPYPIGRIFHVTAMEVASKGALRQPKVEEARIDKELSDD